MFDKRVERVKSSFSLNIFRLCALIHTTAMVFFAAAATAAAHNIANTISMAKSRCVFVANL